MRERRNVKNVNPFDGCLLRLHLLLLSQKRERKMVRKRREPGEPKKRENPFVALKMKLMKMVGPPCGVKFKT